MFIYDPRVAKRKEPTFLVQGEVARVAVQVRNPLDVELELTVAVDSHPYLWTAVKLDANGTSLVELPISINEGQLQSVDSISMRLFNRIEWHSRMHGMQFAVLPRMALLQEPQEPIVWIVWEGSAVAKKEIHLPNVHPGIPIESVSLKLTTSGRLDARDALFTRAALVADHRMSADGVTIALSVIDASTLLSGPVGISLVYGTGPLERDTAFTIELAVIPVCTVSEAAFLWSDFDDPVASLALSLRNCLFDRSISVDSQSIGPLTSQRLIMPIQKLHIRELYSEHSVDANLLLRIDPQRIPSRFDYAITRHIQQTLALKCKLDSLELAVPVWVQLPENPAAVIYLDPPLVLIENDGVIENNGAIEIKANIKVEVKTATEKFVMLPGDTRRVQKSPWSFRVLDGPGDFFSWFSNKLE